MSFTRRACYRSRKNLLCNCCKILKPIFVCCPKCVRIINFNCRSNRNVTIEQNKDINTYLQKCFTYFVCDWTEFKVVWRCSAASRPNMLLCEAVFWIGTGVCCAEIFESHRSISPFPRSNWFAGKSEQKLGWRIVAAEGSGENFGESGLMA